MSLKLTMVFLENREADYQLSLLTMGFSATRIRGGMESEKIFLILTPLSILLVSLILYRFPYSFLISFL